MKKFGGLKKMRTFAARLRNNGNKNKFIEKTGIYTVQEASTEKNKIYREALISLEIKRSVRTS